MLELCCFLIEVERELENLPEATVAELAVLLEDEEAGRERTLGRSSKAVRRKYMTLFICEKFVCVLLLGFCFGRWKKITSDYKDLGSQDYEVNCGQKQRMFNLVKKKLNGTSALFSGK